MLIFIKIEIAFIKIIVYFLNINNIFTKHKFKRNQIFEFNRDILGKKNKKSIENETCG
jgi:hypothetical protein